MTAVPISLPALMPAAIAALIGWRMYRRVRRMIGRQRVNTTRLTLTAIFFPVLVGLVSLSGLRDIVLLEGLAAGVAVGVVLGWLGIRLTRFEAGSEGWFFTPNTGIGIAVSVLFIGRLIYRFGMLYLSTGRVDPSSVPSFGSSPLTLAIFGIVAVYYTTFAIGVLLWYRKSRDDGAPASPTVAAPAP